VSVTTAVRRRLAAAAGAAVGLAVIAAALPAAQASTAAPAGLHVRGSVPIGSGPFFADPISQAPGGAVYFASGKSVYVVNGTSAPKLVRTASGKVVAVAANASELFVEVGKTVTEYRRSTGAKGRHWHLSSPGAVTSAGLIAVGNSVWSWTDWATDGSGAETATISRFSATSGGVHKLTGNGAAGMLAANATGAYYLKFTGGITHVTPSGALAGTAAYTRFPDAITLSGGRLELLGVSGSASKVYLDAYQTSNLKRVYARHVSRNDFAIGGTGAGLLALSCPTASCATGKVSRLSPATGATISVLSRPYVTQIVPGPSGVVITANGTFVLYRLAA
jgi:hypothetical protein